MKLRRRFDFNVAALTEIGLYFDTVESVRSLSTWFEEIREVCATLSSNVHDPGNSIHQQGRMRILCFNKFLQYAHTQSNDP